MALYESVYIARQDVSAAQVEALTEALSEIVSQNGGKVTKSEYWGVRSLAYKIKKNRKGHYSMLNLDAPAAAIQEMERSLKLNEDVLRYMTVRINELEEGPSVMMQSRGSRDDRDRDRGRRGPRRDRDDRRENQNETSGRDGASASAGNSGGTA